MAICRFLLSETVWSHHHQVVAMANRPADALIESFEFRLATIVEICSQGDSPRFVFRRLLRPCPSKVKRRASPNTVQHLITMEE